MDCFPERECSCREMLTRLKHRVSFYTTLRGYDSAISLDKGDVILFTTTKIHSLESIPSFFWCKVLTRVGLLWVITRGDDSDKRFFEEL